MAQSETDIQNEIEALKLTQAFVVMTPYSVNLSQNCITTSVLGQF